MADTSKNINKYLSKKTQELDQAEIDKHDRGLKRRPRKKTKAGSYIKKARKGYEKMLEEADKY